MSKVLHVPEPRHRHTADWGGTGLPPDGTTAICDCGEVIVWKGSSGGMVSWWPESRWERWKRKRREKKQG